MAVFAVAPNLELPWSSSQADDRRFWRVLGMLCVPLLILSIAVPYIKVPEPKREELERLPPQLARVVLEKKELPKPPPPPPVEEKKPEEKKPEEKKPDPKPAEKKPDSKPPEPKKSEPEPVKLQKAIEQAKQSGVLAQMDTLADMRDALDIADVKKPTANLKSTAAAAETVDRSLIGKAATQTSGGVNTAALSRDTGGVALSGRETTVVESKLEEVSAAAADNRQQQTREKAYRGDQDIRQRMEEAKGRIFGIYNRALRENPTLQGKVVFKLVIDPNGVVSSAQIVSSELNDADLERKLLAAVRGINFGASDVLQTTLNYSFDFLPY